MNKVSIRDFYEECAILFDYDGNEIGLIQSSVQLTHVRLQIKAMSAEGYYLIWNNQQIHISSNGEIYNWPEGLFDIEREMQSLIDNMIDE